MNKYPKPLQDFKVLFLYPNFQMAHMLLPAGISILSAVLNEAGIQRKVFDTTLYRPTNKSFDDLRLETLQLKKFNLADSEVCFKETDMKEDFIKLLEEYRPDLVGVSLLQDTFPIALPLLQEAHKRGFLVLAGGVYASFGADALIKEESIDIVCRGEGEKPIVELCRRIAAGKSYDDVQNLWIKKEDGSVIKNQLGVPVNMSKLPYSDYSIFEPKRFYRPMKGKILRMIPVETHRGCPYQCAFCEDPMLNVLYKTIDERYHRVKNPRRLVDEIKYFVEQYQADFIYFNAETFFAMPNNDFVQLAGYYSKEVRLPFWIQTRPETINESRIKLLKEMGVSSINVGLEHGNEEYRRKVLKRPMKNEMIINGLAILEREDIPVTVNNIMGFPYETRELIFDTIELNRHVKSATINVYLYHPYKGTDLYNICEKEGFLPKKGADEEEVVDIYLSDDIPYFKSILNLPTISKKELSGLQRTFVLYSKLPRSEFPRIRIAEQFTEEGNNMFRELREEYLGGVYSSASMS